MVRSSSHRKRSRSRSASPDHKRKSVRDHDKERIRRRSRSRDRLRRSRSRDRKAIKVSESRVRSRPFKIKRRSRSRSKSKEKSSKKDEKKESKPEDEPFDPTSLDKVPDDEDDVWVVTDTLEDPSADDNGVLEEEYDYEADEDDQYCHASTPDKDESLVERTDENAQDSTVQESKLEDKPNNTNNNCDPENISAAEERAIGEDKTKDNIINDDEKNDKNINVDNTNNGPSRKETERNSNEPMTKENQDISVEEASSNAERRVEEKTKPKYCERNNTKDLVNKVKESSSTHRDKIKSISSLHQANAMKNKILLANWPKFHAGFSEQLVRLTKEQIRQNMKLDKELHETRMKHEIERHKAEVEVIRFQLMYWKKKLKH